MRRWQERSMSRVLSLLLAVPLALALSQGRQWIEQAVIDGDPVVRGLPKDEIPSIDAPAFVPAPAATSWPTRSSSSASPTARSARPIRPGS